MPDEVDRAQAANEQHQQDALDAWRRRQSAGPSRTVCLDCEEEIPRRRREALPGVTRCLGCQAAHEKGGAV